MTADIDAILEAELARLGSGLVAVDVGTRWASRRLGNDVHGIRFTLTLEPLVALDLLATAMRIVGRILAVDGVLETADGLRATGPIAMRGLIGAGIGNRNPAVVDVAIEDAAGGECRVEIRGTAKEGLWKQHAGRKAVERIFDTALDLLDAGSRHDAAGARG